MDVKLASRAQEVSVNNKLTCKRVLAHAEERDVSPAEVARWHLICTALSGRTGGTR